MGVNQAARDRFVTRTIVDVLGTAARGYTDDQLWERLDITHANRTSAPPAVQRGFERALHAEIRRRTPKATREARG